MLISHFLLLAFKAFTSPSILDFLSLHHRLLFCLCTSFLVSPFVFLLPERQRGLFLFTNLGKTLESCHRSKIIFVILSWFLSQCPKLVCIHCQPFSVTDAVGDCTDTDRNTHTHTHRYVLRLLARRHVKLTPAPLCVHLSCSSRVKLQNG